MTFSCCIFVFLLKLAAFNLLHYINFIIVTVLLYVFCELLLLSTLFKDLIANVTEWIYWTLIGVRSQRQLFEYLSRQTFLQIHIALNFLLCYTWNFNITQNISHHTWQCRINYGSGGSPEPGPLNSGGLIISQK